MLAVLNNKTSSKYKVSNLKPIYDERLSSLSRLNFYRCPHCSGILLGKNCFGCKVTFVN